jgi:hypothetical protein
MANPTKAATGCQHRLLLPATAALYLVLAGLSAAAEAPAHEWFSQTIEVRGLPDSAQGVPVSTFVDFSQALHDAGVPGTADVKSLRLFRQASSTDDVEVPAQFSSLPQPRLKERPLLPGTPPTISYLGEYRPDGVPKELRVAGQLRWIADHPAEGVCRYRLDFGVLRRGSFLQVPFPPQNLQAFDVDGRTTPVRWFPRMQIRPQQPLDGRMDILEDRELVTLYHIGPQIGSDHPAEPMFRRPFLYPVHGPDGIGLTEFGKPHDPTGSHAHHYSLWISHASVNGQDFWSERKGGVIAHDSLELLEDGPVFCRLVHKTRWMTALAPNTKPVMLDTRTWTFYRSEPDYRLADVELEFAPAGPEPVTLGQTNFGFLAVRVAQAMTVFDGGGEIVNSAGDRNERQAHQKPASWIDQSGPVDEDRWAGVAILDHPDNPGHPTHWHCRNDGWAGAAFNLKQEYRIEPSQLLRLKYRLCLHRHDAARGNVAQRYIEYAARPQIHIGPVSPKP